MVRSMTGPFRSTIQRLLTLALVALCPTFLQPWGTLRPRTQLRAAQLEYFEVYTKDEFLKLLQERPTEQRSVGEQEKIERMVSFLEAKNPTARAAESMLLVGRWQLAFCGVNRGLKVQPVLDALKEESLPKTSEIQSVSLEIFQDYSMKTEIVAAGSSFARQSPLKKPPPRGEVLKEEEGFKRYVKVTYLDDDLLILRGRGASEVYRKVP